jgi:hypothetical protein
MRCALTEKKYKRDWKGNKAEQTNVLLEIKKKQQELHRK